jgi:hypothetical protein
MIHYQLRCEVGHGFDGWFSGSAGFEQQAARGLVECPACGTKKVDRALMAPAIARVPGARGRPEAPPAAAEPPTTATAAPPAKAAAGPMPAEMRALLQRMRAEIESKCDYVGPDFAAEARAIHEGRSDRRGIYGETTPEEAEALREDGIEVARIPWVPRSES